MGDTIKKWHEMQEEKILSDQGGEYTVPHRGAKAKEIIVADETAKYVFLLDFNDSKVYRYDISSLCNKENGWCPDTENCEAFLYGAGHNVSNCEWMVTNSKSIEYGN
tara:strand:- start:1830 stop:2150 length:321 start_codon:yes stop_codon:yes gene_type:complete